MAAKKEQAKGHPKAVLLFLGSILAIGILLSYSSKKRMDRIVDIVATDYYVVDGRLVTTYYNGVSGARSAEIAYEVNGEERILGSRYRIPCEGGTAPPGGKLIGTRIPVAISRSDSEIVTEIISPSDYKRLNLQMQPNSVFEISCLSKTFNFSW